jgi:hypothetical protein
MRSEGPLDDRRGDAQGIASLTRRGLLGAAATIGAGAVLPAAVEAAARSGRSTTTGSHAAARSTGPRRARPRRRRQPISAPAGRRPITQRSLASRATTAPVSHCCADRYRSDDGLSTDARRAARVPRAPCADGTAAAPVALPRKLAGCCGCSPIWPKRPRGLCRSRSGSSSNRARGAAAFKNPPTSAPRSGCCARRATGSRSPTCSATTVTRP